MILNDIEIVRRILTASKSLSFDKLKPFIEDTENDLKIVIGLDFYNELDAYTGNDTVISEAIKLLQKSIAYTAYFKGYDMLNVVFSNQGVHRIETDDGGKKSLFQRQEDNLKRNFKVTGYNKLDTFLLYLEKNKASFPTWTASDEYTLAKRNFINSTSDFNDIYNINNSRLVFLKLRRYQQLAEDFIILPLIGRDYLDELKLQIKEDSLTAWNSAFLDILKKAVAPGTISQGGINLIYEFVDFGIVKTENEINTANFKIKKQIEENNFIHLINSAKDTADSYIKVCAAYLKKNIAEFPTYANSSAYSADANLYSRYTGGKKIVVI